MSHPEGPHGHGAPHSHDHHSAEHVHAHEGCGTCHDFSHLGRRRFFEILGVGVAAALAGCSEGRLGNLASRAHHALAPGAATKPTSPAAAPPTIDEPHPRPVRLDSFPAPRPGRPHTIARGPRGTNEIAITIDDGFCQPCVDAYVQFALTSGIHITFSPNGVYQHKWNPHGETLRSLIEAGQVQIGNHTYSHRDLKKLSDKEVEAELEQNEAWINKTFGITTRPWYRPPFGFHDERVDTIAGSLGYTNVLMWNGSYGDSDLLTPQVLMAQANRYLEPGVIMLGHANHPTVTELFGQIEDLLRERQLTPVTLDEMFGTSRQTG